MNEVRKLLNVVYSKLDIAIELENQGLYLAASEKLIEAAESLLLAAKKSEGPLKRVRFLNAMALIEKAEKLSKKSEEFTKNLEVIDKKNYDEAMKILEEIGIINIKIPSVTFNDVAGLEEVKEEIRKKVIYPLKHPKLAEKYGIRAGGGILLYGPPGTGKTHIARAIANEVKAVFIPINPSSLVSQWFGEFEKNISKIFKAARLCAPSIIFIDEIDAIAPKRRSTSSSVMKRAVPTLLAEMDGITSEKEKPLLIVAATNDPWDIDEAIMRPGRFDEKIYIPPPDLKAREKIFQLNLEGKKCSKEINYQVLAELTEGYSGADIVYICRKASEKVFKEAVENGIEREMTMEDLMEAIKQVKPSITKELLKKYEEYKEKVERRR